jgi:uncharacterized protein
VRELTDAFFKAHPEIIIGLVLTSILAALTLGIRLWQNRHATPHGVLPLRLEATDGLLLLAVPALVFLNFGGVTFVASTLLVSLILWQYRTGSSWTYLRTSLPQLILFLGLGLWAALALYFPLQICAGLIESAFRAAGWELPVQPAVQLFLDAPDLLTVLPVLGLALIGAPLAEEFLFRGIVYPGLRGYLPKILAAIVTGLLFAGLHWHIVSFLPLFLLSCVLCYAFEQRGSLWLCVSIHFWFNTLSAGLLLLAKFYS